MTPEQSKMVESKLYTRQSGREASFAESDGSAFAIIETMRQKGYAVQLDNGLDGTWEAQFYKPTPYGSTNEELEKLYGAGDTLLDAVTEASKNPPNDPSSATGTRDAGQTKTL